MEFLKTLEEIQRDGKDMALLLPFHGEVRASIAQIKGDTVIVDVREPRVRLYMHFQSVILVGA